MEAVSSQVPWGVRCMLICCVRTGHKYGPEYVTRLRDGVSRNLDAPHQFVCLCDKPIDGVECEPLQSGLTGWWSKLELFRLARPLVYFDLDVVITGSLAPLLQWEGGGILKDWWLPGFNSSVMKLTGTEGHVWSDFRPEMIPRLYMGDQQWISHKLPNTKTFPPQWFPSWKAGHCEERVPDGALAVVFHGEPRPHQITSGWVPQRWR